MISTSPIPTTPGYLRNSQRLRSVLLAADSARLALAVPGWRLDSYDSNEYVVVLGSAVGLYVAGFDSLQKNCLSNLHEYQDSGVHNSFSCQITQSKNSELETGKAYICGSRNNE